MPRPKRRRRYRMEFVGYVEHDFPWDLMGAMNRLGWDVLGVWERVEAARKQWKRHGNGTIYHDEPPAPDNPPKE